MQIRLKMLLIKLKKKGATLYKMAYFPLFVNLKDRKIVIIGGGNVAYRKVVKLLEFEPQITRTV